VAHALPIPPGVDAARVGTIAGALREGKVAIVGLWGSDVAAACAVVHRLADAAGASVRRLVSGDVRCRENCPRDEVRRSFLARATLRTWLWIEVDQLVGEAGEAALETAIEQLIVSSVPAILSARTPWRPTEVLAARSYCELDLVVPGYAERAA